jgi:DNA-binding LacI/PurR family transcriptional regulator
LYISIPFTGIFAINVRSSTFLRVHVANQKYRGIFETLKGDISSGRYKPGDRLPSKVELASRFDASHMTVFRAMRELQALGIVNRKVGSGTYVSELPNLEGHVFGLLIPELGQTEVFELICRGMVASPIAATHSLSWGHAIPSHNNPGEAAFQLCKQFIEQKVSGVFFGPEYNPLARDANRRILRALSDADIPAVLIDRYSLKYPERAEYDLVGLDNRRAGYIVTDHLISQGATQVAFFTVQFSNEAVEDRIAGYLAALCDHDLPMMKKLIFRGDPADESFVRAALHKKRIDAIMCANDYIAANLMQTLIGMGVDIPNDIKVAGVDDFRYAGLTPVPLTTFRQPCDEIGAVSMLTMLERIRNRKLPPRLIQLNGRLVVRQSTGTVSHSQGS